MTPTAAVQLSTSLIEPLVTAAVRALALAGAAGLGLAVFRVKATSVRLFTWSAVLYAALAMPLLQLALPPLSIPAPAFLQSGPVQPAAIAVHGGQPTAVASIKFASIPREHPAPAELSPASFKRNDRSPIRWNLVAAPTYLVVAFLLMARFFAGLLFGGRLRRAAQTIRETRLTTRLASGAHASGLSFIPEAAESKFIVVPVTMGVLRPVVLLPATWRDWDDAKLDAVVAHEVSHVVRRDTLTQRLSFLYCAIFWFSPLTWWLNRHLADMMEQASDEAALAGGADRKVYARTLLGFFEAMQGAPGRIWWHGVSMANAGRAEQRVDKILAWKGAFAMSLKKSMAVVVVALALPVVYLVASAQAADRNVNPQSAEVAQNQAPPSPPAASHAAKAPRKPSNRTFYSYGNDDAQSFVIVSGDNVSVTMSGTPDDREQVEELRKKIHGDFIWFRRDGKSYIIPDQATIDRAKGLWAPQELLGKKQEELGKQQEALGKQQEELSGKMEQVRVKVPDMTKDLEKLHAIMKELDSSATMEQIGELQSQIGDLQSKIGNLQSQAGEQQSKLGDEMGALGEKQGKLGELQGELGRQQGELAEQAYRQMKQLLDESLAKGTAQLEK